MGGVSDSFAGDFTDGFTPTRPSITPTSEVRVLTHPPALGEGVGLAADGPRSVLVVGPKPAGDDAVVRMLSRDGASIMCERVIALDELRRALAARSWDVVVDDRSGLVTVDALRAAHSDAPLIVIGEPPGDASQALAVREGAADYVSTGTLTRLAGIVEREARAVRARRALLQRLYEDDRFFELGHDLFCIASFDGRFKRINAMWSTTLGWTDAELMGAPWLDFVHPADYAATVEAGRRLMVDRCDVLGFVNRYRCKDGSYRTLLWTATVDRTQDKLYCVARDITRQKELEEQLLHAQKLEPVGRLAGGIAHDFNNLLTVILSATSSILPCLDDEHSLRSELMEVHDAAMRGAELTKQLLASSGRRVSLDLRVAVLSVLIGDMERLLTRTLGEDVELTLACAPDTGRVFVDVTQLEQAVMNLAVNARDAMPAGGRLTIETANVEITGGSADRHPGVPPGTYVTVVVSDTGEGMTPEVRSRIFEPFFTTKEAGRGTGLGLATAYDSVQRSGGYIAVDSAVGKGTTFTIYLPRTDRPIIEESDPPPLLESPRGSETILLVEDDRAVRALMRAGLRRNGYNVLEAENAGEALLIAEEVPNVDLLLTDVVMPRFSGRQLAQRMRAQRPSLKVLYMSGYGEDQHRELSTAVADAVFLRKPFTTEALMQSVRTTLDVDRKP